MSQVVVFHEEKIAYVFLDNGASPIVLEALGRKLSLSAENHEAFFSDSDAEEWLTQRFSTDQSDVFPDLSTALSQHPDYFTFAFVESPLTRLRRFYEQYTQINSLEALQGTLLKSCIWSGMSFSEFLGILSFKPQLQSVPALAPHSPIVEESVAFCGRFESLQTDWEELRDRFDLPALDAKAAETESSLASSFKFTEHDIALVRTVYRDDLEEIEHADRVTTSNVVADLASPVFVLGAPRSGTSIMAQMLRDVFQYSGQNEGHFWTIFQQISGLLNRQEAFITEAFPPKKEMTTFGEISHERISSDIRNLFLGYCEELFGGQHWMDKTPSAQLVEFAPVLQALFPEARFIFMKRSGIENVLSAQRKFSERKFVDSCQLWSACMMNFANVRSELKNAIMFDQSDFLHNPEQVGLVLSAFLGAPIGKAQDCLEYLSSNFPERTKVANNTETSLDATEWTPAEMRTFLSECSTAMETYGYRMGETDGLAELVNGNQWCKVDTDPFTNGVTLHPNPRNQPDPFVIYRSVNLENVRRLSTTAIANSEGKGVRLKMAISTESLTLAESNTFIEPGVKKPLELCVPFNTNVADLKLSVSLPENAISHAHRGVRLERFLLEQ